MLHAGLLIFLSDLVIVLKELLDIAANVPASNIFDTLVTATSLFSVRPTLFTLIEDGRRFAIDRLRLVSPKDHSRNELAQSASGQLSSRRNDGAALLRLGLALWDWKSIIFSRATLRCSNVVKDPRKLCLMIFKKLCLACTCAVFLLDYRKEIQLLKFYDLLLIFSVTDLKFSSI